MTPEQFTAFLAKQAAGIVDTVEPVVKKAAVNVKKDWRDGAKASAGRHASGYPFTINFDMTRTLTGVEAEVAPDASGQGNLAPILEFGTVHNPPQGDGQRAADNEAKNLGKWIAQAIKKSWR